MAEDREKPVVLETLGEITKTKEKKLRVSVMEFRGHRYVDARVFELANGRWKPDKGITLGKRAFPEFLDLLNGNQELIELSLNAMLPDELEEVPRRGRKGNGQTVPASASVDEAKTDQTIFSEAQSASDGGKDA